MDISKIVSTLLVEKGADMVAPLVAKLGFSEATAKQFVQVAATAIVEKVMAKDQDEASPFDLGALLNPGGGPEIEDVIKDVDTDAVATAAGVTKEQADTGMETIGPVIMDMMKDKGKDALIGALTGSGDAGGMLGKLAGGLFS